MKIYCLYSKELHEFLNKVVNLVLEKYTTSLDISTLKEIELISIKDFAYPTDGQFVSRNKIIVTSRLYEKLPIFNLDLLTDNIDFKMIKQVIYHEMGHINDMVIMPNLYKFGLQEEYNREQIVSQFWLEYIAEKRSAGFEGLWTMELCEQFVNENWRCTLCSIYDNFNSSNFAYLVKVLPYFLSAIHQAPDGDSYLDRIDNALLNAFIKELIFEIQNIEKLGIFDDVTLLYGLYDIINCYYKRFMACFK